MNSIRRLIDTGFVVVLLSLWLPAPAFSASDCALAAGRAGVVQDYRGDCLDGRVHRVAEVMLELPAAADGATRRARQLGWFQRGVPQGVHVVVLTDPEGVAPGFALLASFDATGRTDWSFGLPSSQWPKTGSLLASGPWEDVDGRARAAGLIYPGAKRADGTAYSEGLAMVADLINLAVETSLVAGVQSVDPATVRAFLSAVSIQQPLAGLRAGFSAAAIFPDTDEEAPAANTAPSQPAATPGLDELIRRAMGNHEK